MLSCISTLPRVTDSLPHLAGMMDTMVMTIIYCIAGVGLAIGMAVTITAARRGWKACSAHRTARRRVGRLADGEV